MHPGEVDPGVSELPWGKELSRDHVNRPIDTLARGVNLNCYGFSLKYSLGLFAV